MFATLYFYLFDFVDLAQPDTIQLLRESYIPPTSTIINRTISNLSSPSSTNQSLDQQLNNYLLNPLTLTCFLPNTRAQALNAALLPDGSMALLQAVSANNSIPAIGQPVSSSLGQSQSINQSSSSLVSEQSYWSGSRVKPVRDKLLTSTVLQLPRISSRLQEKNEGSSSLSADPTTTSGIDCHSVIVCGNWLQGIINMNRNGNSANFFSYVCNGKKI